MDGIFLAAGNSRRFGENKLLYGLGKKPMYRYGLESLYEAQRTGCLEHVIVVSQYEEIFQDIAKNFPKVLTVKNPEPNLGISGSIRLGLERLKKISPGSEGCLFAVADQPGLTCNSLKRLVRFWNQHSYNIVSAGCDGQMKNPVIFSADYYEELMTLTKDTGGKAVLYRHLEEVGICQIDKKETEDIDTFEAVWAWNNPLESFPFSEERGHVISLTGAGGKTTLMYALASSFAQKGRKVIVTTTTRIQYPSTCPVGETKEELLRLFEGTLVAAAGSRAEEGKLKASQLASLSDYREIADIVLVEADGAKHFPCKAPCKTEPVIPKESDIVLGVMGMDAIGAPLNEVCFRKRQVMDLLETSDESHIMTEEDLAQILSSEQGTRKGVDFRQYYVVLNKCDNRVRTEQAGKVKQMLTEKGIFHVVLLCLKNLG